MGKSTTTSSKVCVTGGAGYIGSWLVKKLLEKEYTVHATLRNLDDVSKVSLLKSLPNADARLVLFEADIYNPVEFQHAIEGCEFVFHVATPFQHTENSQYKNITEATIAGAKSIAESCLNSGTVRRLIYTASVVAASALKEDGSGFGNFMDESCWTPLNLEIACSNAHLKAYAASKTLAEKEILSYNKSGDGGLEVVSLACGLVGGDAIVPFTPLSVALFVSLLTNSAIEYQSLRFIEELLGKIPIIHIDDACDAHIFCIENPSMNGRFLCTSSFVSSAEIASYYQKNYPKFQVKLEYLDGPIRAIGWGSTKLVEKGFVYKCDTKMILDDCIKCARSKGDTGL